MNIEKRGKSLVVVKDDRSTLEIRQLVGIGRNYLEHAKEQAADVPVRPMYFTKNISAASTHGAPIIVPKICQDRPQVDFEAELCVILGKDARDVSEADALDYVLGYACANDVSARWWQKEGSGGQFFRGKSFDTFAPIGPVVVPAPEIADPQKLAIRLRLNGKTMQDASTADMIFSVRHLISDLSQGMTLAAGTAILTGTPGGVGFTRMPPVFLEHGDVVEVEIEKIGVLKNVVMHEGLDAGVPKTGVDSGFWRERWDEGRIGFHLAQPNPRLVAHFAAWAPQNGTRVLVPLCGKSIDLRWLAEHGVKPVGVELVEKAARDFFAEQQIRSQRIDDGFFTLHRSDAIQIFVGDFFDTTREVLGPVTAVFDRAAMIALPPVDRARYVAHVTSLIPSGARLLLVTVEYDQRLCDGPPFSVGEDEVRGRYGENFEIRLLERDETVGASPALREKGVATVAEAVYLLVKK